VVVSSSGLVERIHLTLLVGVVASLTQTVVAHPGVGIVLDSKGNIFYTDLEQVWRIAPDGSRSIAVPRVHTHELCLDREDNLYGEHLWYEGEASDRWGHYVWRRRSDGVVEKLLGPREGFLTNYSFVRDHAGVMYWVDRASNEIKARSPDGSLATRARHPFRQAGWMTATPDGTLYLTDGADLLRVDQEGRVTVAARGLQERSLTQPHVSERHNLMGIWWDSAGSVYVAVWGGRVVKRVAPDGTVSVAARSAFGWGPTGGLSGPEGELWILETSFTNSVRVRRITRDGKTQIW
jgi:hypothetical protein